MVIGLTDEKEIIAEIRNTNRTTEAGVHLTACKACANQLGVTEAQEELNTEVIYWGEPLTRILKKEEVMLTI